MVFRKKLGFTLIELLATLGIMSVIAAMLFPYMSNYSRKAKCSAAYDSLKNFNDALDRFMIENDGFDLSTWGDRSGGSVIYTTSANEKVYFIVSVGDMNGGEGYKLVQDLTRGGNQTLKQPAGGYKMDDVLVYKIAPDASVGGDTIVHALFYSMDRRGSYSISNGNNEYVDVLGTVHSYAKEGNFPTSNTTITEGLVTKAY